MKEAKNISKDKTVGYTDIGYMLKKLNDEWNIKSNGLPKIKYPKSNRDFGYFILTYSAFGEL